MPKKKSSKDLSVQTSASGITNDLSISWWSQSFEAKQILDILQDFLRSKKSTQTQRAYFRDISDFFMYIKVYSVEDLKSYPIYELSNQVLSFTESFKKSDTYRKDRLLNPRTINRKAYAVSSFFEYLIAHYWYPRNPVSVFTPYSTPQKTSTDDLSQDEFQAIRKYVMEQVSSSASKPLSKQLSSHQQAIIISFLMLSLRRNEVANLRRDDRNTKNNTITVFGKGQKLKYLPLPSHISKLLTTFKELKFQNWYDSDYMLSPLQNHSTTDIIKPITTAYIFKLVQKITKDLQNTWQIDPDKSITPHSFRTTFVKFALENKYTDIEIMNATGHSTSAMIKYYDSRSQLDANAGKMMEGMMGENEEGS